MIARRLEDLICWQLAQELRDEVFAFISLPRARVDFKYCDQIRESARSAPRNTAEGFGRFAPREFAHYLRIAAGSLRETENHLKEGRACGYLEPAGYNRLIRLTYRALKANIRLQKYLRNCGDH
jgi:four helix bundle protein